MGEEGEADGAWAFNAIDALRAKVDAVKQAEAAVRERAAEIEEERETLAAAQRRLFQKEQNLTELEGDLGRQREDQQRRQTELGRAQGEVAQAQDRLAANEARMREWAQSLHVAEQQIVALRDELKSRHAEAAIKLAQFHDRLTALSRREDELADREAAIVETLARLEAVGAIVIAREGALASQVEEMTKLHAEWMESTRKREGELSIALGAVEGQTSTQGALKGELASILQSLRLEVEKAAGQRQSLVERERRVLEFEKNLTTAIGSVRLEPDAAPNGIRPVEEPPSPRERVVAPAVPSIATDAPKPTQAPRTAKGRAMEKMARALELAKRAHATGRDTEEVRELVRLLRQAYDAKNWEDVDSLSEKALERLSLLTDAAS
ncbi:MAG: hypothetical protein E6K18_01220 [Methanobacteriota archaeon]|nr:MAG: hypothetical protein E6K18_01220 [Euryarchaeota archaeon]